MLNLRRTNTIDSGASASPKRTPMDDTSATDTNNETNTSIEPPRTPIKRIFNIRRTRTFDSSTPAKPSLQFSTPPGTPRQQLNNDNDNDMDKSMTRQPGQQIKKMLGGLRRTATFDTAMDGSSKRPTPNNTICEVQPELEWLAEDLQKELIDQKLVQDHPIHHGIKTIHKSFSGKELIDTLHKLMLESRVEESTNATREDALEKGNQMITQLSFFKHATNIAKPLLDSANDYYQFHHNLPSQVQRCKNQNKSPWDKVRLIETHVEVKDRRHRLIHEYPNCFIACEAVDVMMELKLAVTREKAVQLMRYLNTKVFCCEHVTQEHEFKDEHLYFYFIPKHERMPEKKPRGMMDGSGRHHRSGSTRCPRSKSPRRRHHKPRRVKSRDEGGLIPVSSAKDGSSDQFDRSNSSQ